MPPRLSEDEKKKRAAEKRIKEQRAKNMERALKEERLGLTAIATAFVQVHGDPEAVLVKLEAMVRAAVEDPRVKPRTKQAMIDGQRILQRVLEIHVGVPQTLFDDALRPSTGHVNPKDVRTLANPPEEQQVGMDLDGSGEPLGDVLGAHEERQGTERRIRDLIVTLMRENGPQADPELYDLYLADESHVSMSFSTFCDHRKELVRMGRLIDSGERKKIRGRVRPVWDLIERTALV